MANDWFRKTTWTKEDENEFLSKLQKAKIYNRPQYLKIQAYTLVDTNNNELLMTALNLLQKYFDDYPDDRLDRSSAFKLTGDIYYKMGKYDMALEQYNNAIEFEEIFPNVKTEAYLKFSEMIIQLNKIDHFEQVKALLLKRDTEINFPINKYIANAILSIIYKHENNIEKSNYYKKLAEDAANTENSDFRWNKKLGLVKNRNKLLDKLMRE
ncbi:hypothetical protein AGMMS49587_20170 [Spirochaetia bacterium]|nr:hypothetical protein AGMMS49587_20170 [Spirochaetia bacterium]